MAIPRVESDPETSHVGAMQAGPFDPAKLQPVGVWELVPDSDSLVVNRRVRRINRFAPVAKNPAWTPQEAVNKRIFASWGERFDARNGDILPVLEWLQPGYFAHDPPTLGTHKPTYLFWNPHGSYGDSRTGGNIDFFSALGARADGHPEYVDGFYEGCRLLGSLGVQVIKHDGTPGSNKRYTKWTATEYDKQHKLNLSSNAAIGLDAIVVRPRGGYDERTGDDYWTAGQGCLMEGVPNPNDPTQAAWLAKPWPVVCTLDNAWPRVFDQAPWAVGKWPAAGTPEWEAKYGNRYFFWCLWLNSFGTGYDAAWNNEAAAAAYLDAYAAGVRGIRAKCPRSIVLLPKGLPELCVRWNVPASEFLPD